MQTVPDNARCIDCNYPLRGLPNARCPECGRDFTPDDPATMNVGCVPGFVARRLIRRSGFAVVIVAATATIAILVTTGLPRFVSPRLADTLFMFDTSYWRWRHYSLRQAAYLSAIVAWLVVILFYFLRAALRWIARWVYQPPHARHWRRRTHPSLLLLALISVVLILFGWPLRVAYDWTHGVEDYQTTLSPSTLRIDSIYNCPIELSREEQLVALRMSIAHSWSQSERIAALGLLMSFRDIAPSDFADIASKGDDAEIRVLAIHILSLYREPRNAEHFCRLLEDQNSEVRAAAADGIGILLGPVLTRVNSTMLRVPLAQINSRPPISLAAALTPNAY